MYQLTKLALPTKSSLTNRQNTLWSTIRATPMIFLMIVIFATIINTNTVNVGLLLTVLLNKIANPLFKLAVVQLYKMLGKYPNGEIPILGRGSRPSGASNTGLFITYPPSTDTTWGMPSGHSQIAWMVATYLALYWTKMSKPTPGNIAKTVFVFAFAILISFSRVFIDKVHTYQQVIVGGILGVIIGTIGIFITKKIHDTYYAKHKYEDLYLF